MSQERQLTLYIGTCLNRYVATANDDLGFIDSIAREGEECGYTAFSATVDTVMIGHRTYDKVVTIGVPDPHPGRALYVIRRAPRPSLGAMYFHTDDLVVLVRKL